MDDTEEPVTVSGLFDVARTLLGVDDSDPMLEPGVLVLAAGMMCGARNLPLHEWTGIPMRTVNTVSYWLRASGIWRGGIVYAPWRDEDRPDGERLVTFVMHTMTAVGDLYSADGGVSFTLRQPGQAVDPDAAPPGWTQAIRDEADAYRMLEAARWTDGQPDECPHCHRAVRCYFLQPRSLAGRLTTTGRPTGRRIWKCSACRRQFSVLTGTRLGNTHVPLRVILGALAEYLTAPESMTQGVLVRRYRLRPATANHVLELTGSAATTDRPLTALVSS